MVLPGPLTGIDAAVRVPTSKSLTNRALVAAAAAGGGRISAPLDCEDTRFLAAALDRAGWPVDWGDAIVIGARRPVSRAEIDLGNSGTGSRLILGLLACVPGSFVVDGSQRLRERPMRPLLDALRSLGSEITDRDGLLPVRIEGTKLAGGRVRIRPEVSSQFVSALMLAAPLMRQGLDLEVEGTVPSRPYLDLTVDVLEAFSARVEQVGIAQWRIASGGLQPTDYRVEGDWSAAAFATAAVAVAGGRVRVGPLAASSAQGDRALCRFLEDAGVVIRFSGDELVATGPASRSFTADLGDTPDLFPALIAVAAAAPVGTVLTGLEHLKHKESDRLSVMLDNLDRIGVKIERDGCAVRVSSGIDRENRTPTKVTAAGDHRIAMAMAVVGLARGGLELDDPACVGKSFPGFWTMWEQLVTGAPPPR